MEKPGDMRKSMQNQPDRQTVEKFKAAKGKTSQAVS
jgi:hypothetical protein